MQKSLTKYLQTKYRNTLKRSLTSIILVWFQWYREGLADIPWLVFWFWFFVNLTEVRVIWQEEPRWRQCLHQIVCRAFSWEPGLTFACTSLKLRMWRAGWAAGRGRSARDNVYCHPVLITDAVYLKTQRCMAYNSLQTLMCRQLWRVVSRRFTQGPLPLLTVLLVLPGGLPLGTEQRGLYCLGTTWDTWTTLQGLRPGQGRSAWVCIRLTCPSA